MAAMDYLRKQKPWQYRVSYERTSTGVIFSLLEHVPSPPDGYNRYWTSFHKVFLENDNVSKKDTN